MLYQSGGREEPAASSWRKGVPRDPYPRSREIISRKSSQGSANIIWLLGLLLFLVLNGFWWFVWRVYQIPPPDTVMAAPSSPLICQHPYGKYLVIDKIDHKVARIGKYATKFVNFTATVKNIGSREVTDIEGYWLLVDGRDGEHREDIHISRTLQPGDTQEIFIQKRVDGNFVDGNFNEPGGKHKIFFEKVEIKEAVNSP